MAFFDCNTFFFNEKHILLLNGKEKINKVSRNTYQWY